MNRSLYLGVCLLVAVYLLATYTSAQSEPLSPKDNPLTGKTVIFETMVGSFSPKQGVRTESLAGREFFAWSQELEGEEKHAYWIPADSVTKIRIFDSSETAEAFEARRKPK